MHSFTIRPFKRLDNTVVAACSNLMLIFLFLISMLVKLHDDIVAASDPATADSVLGFQRAFDVSVLLIVIACIQVLTVVGAILYKLALTLQAAR